MHTVTYSLYWVALISPSNLPIMFCCELCIHTAKNNWLHELIQLDRDQPDHLYTGYILASPMIQGGIYQKCEALQGACDLLL